MRKGRLAAATLIFSLLIGSSAQAATWREGLGPAQPYAGVPEVNLEETMGYTMLFPRENMPADYFCDVLEFYLPREDVERGEGKLQLYDDNGLFYECDFTDESQVEIRPLEEEELTGLMWGGGTCVSVKLPVSLTVGAHYYVHMDEGCFTASGGNVKSLSIVADDAWVPVVNGDFGVSALCYREGGVKLIPGAAEELSTESGEAQPQTESAPAPEGTGEGGAPLDFSEYPLTLTPHIGDAVVFDLTIGGDAVSAVVYSENNSVEFDIPEYSASTQVTGRIVGDEVNWGLVFLNENGDVLDILSVVK